MRFFTSKFLTTLTVFLFLLLVPAMPVQATGVTNILRQEQEPICPPYRPELMRNPRYIISLGDECYKFYREQFGVSQATTPDTETATPSDVTALSVDPADAYELDNSFAQAKTILPDIPQTHSIYPLGDVDYMTFTLTTASGVTLETSGADLYGDTEIYLFNQTQLPIAYNDQDMPGNYSRLSVCLPAGVYYFSVNSYVSNRLLENYEISFTKFDTSLCAPEISVFDTSWNTPITNNDGSQATEENGRDFGEVDVVNGSRSTDFYIFNSGSEDLNAQVQIAGVNASDFTSTAIASIPPGEGDWIYITFNPSDAGVRTATVTIASNDGDENPFTFPIQGMGINGGAPDMDVYGAWNEFPFGQVLITNGDVVPSVEDGTDFREVVVGDIYNARYRWFMICNHGNANLLNTTIQIGGANASDFNLEADLGSNVIQISDFYDYFCEYFIISFTPSAAGLRTATVSISSNDPDENPHTFDIQGVGVINGSPELDVYSWADDPWQGQSYAIANGDNSPSLVDDTDFGEVNYFVGAVQKDFIMFNYGSAELDLTGIPIVTISGPNASDFTVIVQPQLPIIWVDYFRNFYVRFDPSAPGLRTATVSIASNDADENPYTFAIQGTGTDEPVITSITRAGTSPTSAASVDFTVSFSEDVQNVDVNDFALTTTGVSGASITGVTPVSASVYTVTVNTGSGDGTIKLVAPANALITDLSGNPLGNLPFTTGEVYTVLKDPVVLQITPATTRFKANSNVTFTVTFSESVTGVDKTDFQLLSPGLANASITTVSGSGSSYTVSVFTGMGKGTIQLNLTDNDTIKDLSLNPLGGTGTGNGNFSSTDSIPVAAGPATGNTPKDSGSTQKEKQPDSTPATTPTPTAVTGSQTLPQQPSTTSAVRLPAPKRRSPVDKAVVSQTPTFFWTRVAGGVNYQFQIDNNKNFDSPTFTVNTGKTYHLPPRLPNGTYYWHVRTQNSNGQWSEWSATYLITIK